MKIFTVVFIVMLITACSSGDQDALWKESAVDSTASVDGQFLDPCSVVLTPLDNTDPDDLISHYQRAVVRDSLPLANLEKLGWAFISKARASFDTGFYSLAEQTAQCIEQRQKNSQAALLLKGHVLHNLHRFIAAELVARQLIQQRGLWFEYALLGDVLLEQGKLSAAADAYQVMMDQRPGPQAYTRAAHLRWLKGDLDGAIEMMALSMRAIGGRASEVKAWTAVRLGNYLLQAGEFEDAQLVLDHARSLHNNYAPALLAQGRLLLAQNNPAGAVQLLKKAEQIVPLPEYQWLLIEAYQENQQPEQARKIESRLKHTGASEDRRTYSLYLASTRQHAATALQLAKQDFETRQDIFSHDALAWSLYSANQLTEARHHIRRAVSEGTQDARLFLHAAVITQAAGDVGRAQYWRQKAIAIQHMLLPSERTALDEAFTATEVAMTSPGIQ